MAGNKYLVDTTESLCDFFWKESSLRISLKMPFKEKDKQKALILKEIEQKCIEQKISFDYVARVLDLKNFYREIHSNIANSAAKEKRSKKE